MDNQIKNYEEFLFNIPRYCKLFISNYKLSFKIAISSLKDYKILLQELQRTGKAIKTYRNFCLIVGSYKYILYCNGHINVSGVKHIDNNIHIIIREIIDLTGRYPIVLSDGNKYAIDNITATSYNSFNETVTFKIFSYISKVKYLKSFLTKYKNYQNSSKIGIIYEPEIFHAIKVISDVGTALIFSNCTINYLGAKSKKNVRWLHFQICFLLHIHNIYKNEIFDKTSDEAIILINQIWVRELSYINNMHVLT